MSGRENGGDVLTQAECGDPALGARARDYVLGTLEPDSAERMEDHLAGCVACSARVTRYEEGLRRLQVDARGPLRAVRLPLLALAAILFVASALVLWHETRGLAPGDGPWRSPGPSFTLLSPAGAVATPPSELRWSAPDPQADCRAEIVRLDLAPLFEERAAAPGRIPLPEGTRAALASGDEFLWRVRCSGASGEETSSYVGFQVVTSPAPGSDGATRESPPR
ncbi:MAG TPA: zf-HC2 domain-containing protein [Candidatus Polarisedimenticolia bacterium]|nr:zf-HC2 domain-containing protein [Candidatus Polarisedimenticolia bacterium]